MTDVPRSAIQPGDQHAADELMPLVYSELRSLAAAQLANERAGQTLNATALVHEAYLRLVGDRPFADRRHFFLAAAAAVRRILIERARRKKRRKHGGGRQRLDMDLLDPPERSAEDERLLAVDEALDRLAAEEPEVAQVVRLRWYAGLSIEKTAAALDLSVRTVNRHWAYARAWLFQLLKAGGDEGA
jgi:RNA polymerase sigma factor (TIGR02999 family)